jgi:hypothetical protein
MLPRHPCGPQAYNAPWQGNLTAQFWAFDRKDADAEESCNAGWELQSPNLLFQLAMNLGMISCSRRCHTLHRQAHLVLI